MSAFRRDRLAAMDKFTVARLLDEISRYIELGDPNPFKARAFEKAARAVEDLEGELDERVREGTLLEVEGIGKATGQVIEEIVRTGSSPYLDELRAQYPPGILELLRVPKLGLKKIGALHAALGVGSLDELEAAARDGRLAKLKGFGAKSAGKILEGIAFARERESKFLLPIGLEVAESLRQRIEELDGVTNVAVSGSIRRRLEIIRNVNLVVAARDVSRFTTDLSTLVSDVQRIDEHTLKGVARGEMDVFVHLTTPASFGTTLLRTTGSTAFLTALEEIRKLPAAKDEETLFEKLGVALVEPERRESADDLAKKKRTKLVDVDQIRGTFHVHTTWSDGRNSVAEMLDAARDWGWEYVGISDHSKVAAYAGGLTEEKLKGQRAQIAAHEKKVSPMRVFRGTEADILADGSIDYGAKILSTFDFVVASVHSGFQMDRDEMTERILKAMDDPHVTFLGHLTGRLLLSRNGYTVDYDRIFDRAAERGVMIEINGNPRRLDVDWRYLQRAADRGVVFSIHPDAHSVAEYQAVITGTWVARKGGLSPKQIFNTRSVAEVEEGLRARRGS
jgi:DNA polymerase (family 10)